MNELQHIDIARWPDCEAPDGATHILFEAIGHSFWRVSGFDLYASKGGQWVLLSSDSNHLRGRVRSNAGEA